MAAKTTVQTDIRGGTLSSDPMGQMMLPGGGYDVVPIRGMEGLFMTMGALTQQISDLAREMKISNSRQAQALGLDPLTASGLNIKDIIGDVISESGVITTGRGVSAGQRDDLDSMHDGVGKKPKPGQDPVAFQIERQQEQFQRQRESIGYQMPEAYSVGTVRQQVGRYAQKELMNRGPWGDQYSLDEGGRWHDPGGRFVSAQDSGVTDFMGRQSVMMAGRGAAQALAQTGSFKEAGAAALGSSAGGVAVLRAAGLAGLAVGGIDKAGDFFESQRAANAEWQSMMGGTNLGATRERFDQKMFGYSQFGVLDSDQAEALYRGVAKSGLKGDDRTNAQNFALTNYKQFGMDINESMKIINIAAKTGQESLIGVSMALERVTETAVEAGVNADKMRAAWLNSFEAMSGQMTGGSAITTATGFTASFSALGPEFAETTVGVGDQTKALVANQLGMTMGELAIQMGRPGGEDLYLKGFQQVASRRMSSGISAEAVSALRGSYGHLKPSEIKDIDKQHMREAYLAGGGNEGVARRMLDSLEIKNVSDVNAPTVAAMIIAGVWNPEEAAAEAQADLDAKGSRMLGGLTEAEFAKEGLNWSTGMGTKGMGNRAAFNDQSLNEELSGLRQSVEASATGGPFNFTDDAIRKNFLDDVVKTGQRGGFSEYIATNSSARTTAAKVTIIDKDGRPKTVDLDTAMRHYRKQLDDGTAIIAGDGESAGSTVGSVFKDMAVGAQNLSGNITVSATPELRRLLNFTATGDAFDGDPISPDQRATGN